jgi:hypothetical protein
MKDQMAFSKFLKEAHFLQKLGKSNLEKPEGMPSVMYKIKPEDPMAKKQKLGEHVSFLLFNLF